LATTGAIDFGEVIAGEVPIPTDLRTDRPHSARIYDYLLGGKDNFEADRAAADTIVANLPDLPVSMRANRRFMARVVHYLAAERGIRQFLDVGTGLPTVPNLHQVVQAVDPAARVVYVDNDPIVLAHARALLTSTPEGRISYVDGDLFKPDAILSAPELRETLDLSRPVAMTLIAVIQYVMDEEQAHQIIATLTEPLPPGSALAISAVTNDSAPQDNPRAVAAYNSSGITVKARDRASVEALFNGWESLDPGVTLVHRWRPGDEDQTVRDEQVYMYGGVAIKPGKL
jgi:O-methyltransferase involved in polyketide biosynthesis